MVQFLFDLHFQNAPLSIELASMEFCTVNQFQKAIPSRRVFDAIGLGIRPLFHLERDGVLIDSLSLR
jgi:hypothetical protein